MLSKRIKSLRTKYELTQKELADKLCLTPKMVSFYELGERVPPPDVLEKIADIFHVTTDYLLCRHDYVQCPSCGILYDPLSQIDTNTHNSIHAKYLKAVEKFGDILSYKDANNIRNKSIETINSYSSTDDEIVEAFEDYLKAEFSISMHNCQYDLNHVDFKESCAIELEKWMSKDAVSEEIYQRLVDKYGTPSYGEYFPASSRAFKNGVTINVLGRVAAGIPLEAIEDIIDTEEISSELAKTGEFFGLQINGDSMEPKFSKGDVVIVRRQSDAESGDIVIALINGDDATCKRLRKYRDGIELISTNPTYKPMFFSNDEIENKPVKIIGKVVELRAKF